MITYFTSVSKCLFYSFPGDILYYELSPGKGFSPESHFLLGTVSVHDKEMFHFHNIGGDYLRIASKVALVHSKTGR